MDLSTTRFVAATCTLFLPFEEHGKHLNTFERLLRMEQKLFALATAASLQLPEVHFLNNKVHCPLTACSLLGQTNA